MSTYGTVAHTYRTNRINTASPLELLLLAYDAALIGCSRRDLERTTKAISVLRNALDPSYDAQFTLGLFRIYQYCADLARKGKYDEAAIYLSELRNTWAQVKVQVEEVIQQSAPTPLMPALPVGAQLGVMA